LLEPSPPSYRTPPAKPPAPADGDVPPTLPVPETLAPGPNGDPELPPPALVVIAILLVLQKSKIFIQILLINFYVHEISAIIAHYHFAKGQLAVASLTFKGIIHPHSLQVFKDVNALQD
jgi:hypothetical protein